MPSVSFKIPEQSLCDPRVKAFLLRRDDCLHTFALLKRDLIRLPEFHALKRNSRNTIEHLAYLLLVARIASENARALSDYSAPRGLEGKRHKGKRLDRITILSEKRRGIRVIASKRIKLPPWAKPHKALLIDAKKLRHHALWTAADYLTKSLNLGPEMAIRMGVAALNLVGLGVAPLKMVGPQVANTSLAAIRSSEYAKCTPEVAVPAGPEDGKTMKNVRVEILKRSRADLTKLRSAIVKREFMARQLASSSGWDIVRATERNRVKLQELIQEIELCEASLKGCRLPADQANRQRDLERLQKEREMRSRADFIELIMAVMEEHRQIDRQIDQYRRHRRTSLSAKR